MGTMPLSHLAFKIAACCLGATATIQLFPPPADPAAQPLWLKDLEAERDQIYREINYTGEIYEDAAVNWTRLSYVQPQTLLYDRYLYNPETHEYTVDRYLDDVDRRYGGIDSILLWPTYTNIGIDARNQFDYFRALPSGLEGLRALVARFKARGVRVLLAYNPWDLSTRLEGEAPWDSLVKLAKLTGSDGFNGDTMATMYRQFWTAGVEAEYRIVGEMEGGGYARRTVRPQDESWESSKWDPMGWGYFQNGSDDGITYKYDTSPGIDRLKWLDGRRMTHVCDRWAKNRTDALQYAFMNGAGFESWENVWSIFMHITPRDGEALRRVATLFRWLGRQEFIQAYSRWEPFTTDIVHEGPFRLGGPMGSKFVHRSGDLLWLVVNRAAAQATIAVHVSGCTGSIFDLYNGVPKAAGQKLEVAMEAHGYAALLCTNRSLPVEPLLSTMRNLTKVPLSTYSTDWSPLQQTMASSPLQPPRTRVRPPRTALVPRTQFRFRTAGVEIEGGCDGTRDTWGVCCNHTRLCPRDASCSKPCANRGDDSRGVDVQFPWEHVANRFHDRLIEVGPFFMDKHLVSKADYAYFMLVSGYRPRDPFNFLKGWKVGDDGVPRPPPGTEQQPVVWVSLQEARSYCAWAGKRLPHAYEWQLAAQGTDGRLYPWGNDLGENGTRFPAASGAHTLPELPDVGSFSPQGDSVYGVADLVGHVWQFTDEFQDDHTRKVLLKGSSFYTPMVSGDFPAVPQSANWYFPKALEVDRHNLMMLMDDSYERAGTLGFRCVADHEEGFPGPFHYRDSEVLRYI